MPDLRDIVAPMCGRSITAVRVEEHVAAEARSLVSLWLEFSDGGIGFRTAPDGWGLAAEPRSPMPSDLGEYGRTEIADVDAWRGIAVGRIDAVWTVISPESSIPVGVRWQVTGESPVAVYGYDDELVVGADPSAELDGITYEEVCGSV